MQVTRLLLFFSVCCAVISVTPVGDNWRFLVLLTPDWMAHPNSVPFDAPHESVARGVVLAIHGMLLAGANSGWWSEAAAAALIADGLPLGGVLQFLAAVLFVVAAVIWAVESMRHGEKKDIRSEPVVSGVVDMSPPSAVTPAQRIAQLELAITNLLLNPDTHAVSEELADLSRQLRELSRELAAGSATKR
jgi:hypothetical protein